MYCRSADVVELWIASSLLLKGVLECDACLHLLGVESGELEPQRKAEEEEDSKPEVKRERDDWLPERSKESTIHTVPELLTDTLQVANFYNICNLKKTL